MFGSWTLGASRRDLSHETLQPGPATCAHAALDLFTVDINIMADVESTVATHDGQDTVIDDAENEVRDSTMDHWPLRLTTPPPLILRCVGDLGHETACRRDGERGEQA